MTLVKSTVVGLVSMALGAILLTLGAMIVFAIAFRSGPPVSIDVISVARNSPLVWIIEALFFVLGFYWEFRRAKLRQSK